MDQISRRHFFKQAGSVAAVVGAVAIAPTGIGAASASTKSVEEPELSSTEGLSEGEHLVAHVRDARTGEISLFVGTREVTLRDRKVAARLVRAAK